MTEALLPDLLADEARELTARIRDRVSDLLPLIVEAYDRRVWIALGHESWFAYCDAELAGLQLGVGERGNAVDGMRAAGMSLRAIGAALSVSKDTVARQLSQDETVADRVTGLDGRSRPASTPRRYRRRPGRSGTRDPSPGSYGRYNGSAGRHRPAASSAGRRRRTRCAGSVVSSPGPRGGPSTSGRRGWEVDGMTALLDLSAPTSLQDLGEALRLLDGARPRDRRLFAASLDRGVAWMAADVTPGLGDPLWHVAVVELETGIASYTRRAIPRELVTRNLRALGVRDARFEMQPATESRDNPYAAKSTGTAVDTRFVYFIESVGGGLIKIGVAHSPVMRFEQIQRMSPVPLRLMGVVPGGGQQEESRLHKQFDSCRAYGEWFYPTPELLAYIARNSRPA